MKMKRLGWLNAILLGCAATLFTACNDSEPMGKGEVDFEITDAPIDDASVKSVVVTVADVKVDGKSISGFTKQTIDLKAYQDGNTRMLGNTTLDARTYSTVTLVLDLDQDAQGNRPGCYVLDQNNTKYTLKNSASATMDIAINQSWKALKNLKTRVVMDFDLRKSIKYSDDPSVRFSFVGENNLKSAVRLVTTGNSGTIKGTYQNDSDVEAEKIVVYAYKKGTFNATTETQAQGQDGIQFIHAVSSSEVKAGLTGSVYTLAYLPEGEYELHFASYSKNATSGRMSFETMLQSETSVNGSVSDFVKVQANTTVNISTSIKGIF